MVNIKADSIDSLYSMCITQILENGEMTHPRGFNCLELSPCSITLTDPQNNILVNDKRKARWYFMGAELLWILMGRKDVEMISFYNSRISQFSDDGKEFFGSYGPKIVDQLPYVIETLTRDPWSRQALINIWREKPPITKDVPCTVVLHFIRRPVNKLNLVVYMRSQDIWLGFPYDVHNFTCLQNIVASMLNIKLGTFTLIQGSLHLYENNKKEAMDALRAYPYRSQKTPLCGIKSFLELQSVNQQLAKFDEKIRSGSISNSPYKVDDLLIDQKLNWLQTFGRKKHETSNR